MYKRKRFSPPPPPKRPPYTGPAQVVTTGKTDEMKRTFVLYLYPDIEKMSLRCLTTATTLGRLPRSDHPELYALACLLKDAPETKTLEYVPVYNTRTAYSIQIKLGEIAAVDPALAEVLRLKLLCSLFGDSDELRGTKYEYLFRDELPGDADPSADK